MKEKLELMLKVYREQLERTHDKDPYHTDFLRCIRIMAQIELLENLYYYVTHEGKPK